MSASHSVADVIRTMIRRSKVGSAASDVRARHASPRPGQDAKPAAPVPAGVWAFGWLVLVGVLLLALIQPSTALDLKYHWASSALLVAGGGYWATRAPPVAAWPVLALWLGAVGAVSLVATWFAAETDHSLIAGVLPYSDAAAYFADAQRILIGEPIASLAVRRPMFTAWLAGLLAFSGNDLRIALLWITMFVALSLGWAAWALGRDRRSVIVSVFFAAVVWLYYRRFVGTTLTEHLGIGLGLLAFGFLWVGAQQTARTWAFLGLLLLTLALNARAGAFFVLPMLVLWMGMRWAAEGRRFSWATAGLGAGVVVAGFVANRALLEALGGSGAASFANFSSVLYGLVMGGDWTLALQQHPELARLSATAQSQEIYRLAFAQIVTHPSSVLVGALRAWASFLPTAFSFAADVTPKTFELRASYALSLLAVAGLTTVWLDRRQPRGGMLVAVLIGTFLSVPFVPPWDSDLMRAYAATLPFIALMPALGVDGAFGAASAASDLSPVPRAASLAGGCLLLAAFFCFALPLAARGTYPALARPTRGTCPSNEVSATARLIPGTYVRFAAEEMDPRKLGHTLRPMLGRLDAAMLAHAPAAAMRYMAVGLGTSAVPLGRLRLNAADHAPAEAEEFIESVQEGQALAMATWHGPDGLQVEPGLFARGPARMPTGDAAVCIESSTGRLGEVRIQ